MQLKSDFGACCRQLSRLSAARALVWTGCLVVAGYQCCQLLGVYCSEQVVSTVAQTPSRQVDVPSFTVCENPTAHKQRTENSANETISQSFWRTGLRLEDQLIKCLHKCKPDASASRYGEETPVRIGSWRSWVADTPSLCHTLTPNITWGELFDISGGRMVVTLKFDWPIKNDQQTYQVFIHPRRHPIISDMRLPELFPDQEHRVSSKRSLTFALSSKVHNRLNLRRAICNGTAGYDVNMCLRHCAHSAVASAKNCSTPEMALDFPHLPECDAQPGTFTNKLYIAFSAHTNTCNCLPACHTQQFIVENVISKPSYYNGVRQNSTLIRLRLGRTPQEVSTETYAYPLASLVSEIAGGVSLLLGVSAFSVIDQLLASISRGRSRVQRKIQPDPREAWHVNVIRVQR